MGHSESTAGACSIAKMILSYENRRIPPNINFVEIRPGLESLESGRLRVVAETEDLTGPLISINSFGFGGGNAHALFRANLKEKVNHGIPTDTLPRLVIWSSRTEEGINTIMDSIVQKPLDAEYIGLLHNCAAGESHQANIYRGYGVFSQTDQVSNATCLSKDVKHYSTFKRPMVWVYSGMGSQWCTMGADLMKIPMFAESIEKSHKILAAKGLDVKDIITSSDPDMFENILHSFVGIAAIQIALTDILKALEIEPDFIIGHSVGELGCAYADGCFTAEEMILSAYSRGMASLETNVVFGSMAAVGLSYKKLRSMVPEGIEIACHNSADSCTISGPAKNIAAYVAELKSKNIFAKEVACSNIPYHSKYIAEMGPNLLKRLTEVIKEPKQRSNKWLSSSVPKVKWDLPEAQYSSAYYHTNNLLNSVLFEETSSLLPKNALTIEIAPHSLLQAILRKSMPEAVHVGLTQRENKNNSTFFLSSLGILHENGVDMDVGKLYPPVSFPVSRGTPMISPLIKWQHSEEWFVTRFESQKSNRSGERHLVINLSDQEFDYINGHTIDGRVLFPATAYLHFVWETIGLMMGVYYFDVGVIFEDVKFVRATALPKSQDVELIVMIQHGTGRFEITEGTSVLATGYVKIVENVKLTEIDRPEENGHPTLLTKDFYKELRLRGYHYNNLFKSVEQARGDGMLGRVKWNANWIAFMDCLLQIYIIGQDSRALLLPTGIQMLSINPHVHKTFVHLFENEDISLEVLRDQNRNILRCGGIEVRGLQANPVARRRPPGIPVLETYQFIPHLPTPYLNKVDMARFCVQLALENLPTTKVLSVEIDANDGKDPLSEILAAAYGDLPLVTTEMNYLTSKSMDLGSVLVSDSKLNAYKNAFMVIRSNCLSDKTFLDAISGNVQNDGFIISREPNEINLSVLNQLSSKHQLIAIIPTENETIVMLQCQKKIPGYSQKVIRVTSQNLDWINDLKKAIKEGPVLAYSEKEEFSGILGLVNCIRKEPNGTNLKCVFIDDYRSPKFNVDNDFYKSFLKQGLAINVFKNGHWGSYRHLLLETVKEEGRRIDHCYANCLVRGDLSSLTWLHGPYNHGKPDGNIVKLQYASLNFRDVMLATGKLTAEVFGTGRLDQLCILGFEFSGINESGKRVMGMVTSGALATHIKGDDTLLWDCPDEWSLEEAATVPVVYGTVYSAFFLTTKIEKGKSILIHAGSGGVGLAAIRVAFAYGLDVFTTVSTEEKTNFLLKEFPQLKRENIGNSRDISFEDMIMNRTSGKGVDYVLNSLAEEKLHASIRCLGKGGKFLEIGKFDLANDTKIGLGSFLKEIAFHSVLVDNLFHADHEAKMVLQRLVERDIQAGIIKPLKTTVFNASELVEAFRFLASGKHVGKVLLKIRENENDVATLPISAIPRAYCNSYYTYIIPGGLGGFGLELADWLVLRGCRKLVLSSSRGITKQYQAYRIKIWQDYGVKVVVNTSDISSKIGCEELIRESMKLGPVGGIFNLAVLLRDSIFENQDATKFNESMAPKAVATKYLDEISRVLCPELQYFVVFSSVSCGRGNAGQSNYGMANSVMERVMEQRHGLGLPAKAIQWGAVGEVGLVADMQEDLLDMEIGGTLQQRISSCLEELDTLLTVNHPIVASMVVAEKKAKVGAGFSVIEAVMSIMSIREMKSVSMDATLSEIGMDSLMGVEIRQMLEREYELFLSPQDLRSLTFRKLQELMAASETVEIESAKTKFASDDVPVGVELMLRNLGDEETSNQTILRLISQDNSTKHTSSVLLIPGIEGVAGNAWRSVANGLSLPSYMLQLMNSKDLENVNDVTQFVYDDIIETVFDKTKENFYIVGYSFGAMVAIELTKMLERGGKKGKLLLIDGAPTFLKKLVVDQMPMTDSDEAVQTVLLAGVLRTVYPDEKADVLQIMANNPTWEDRVDRLMEMAKDQYIYSTDYLRLMANCLFQRIKMVLNYKHDPKNMMKSPVTLIRPTEISIVDVEEDYGLHKITNGIISIKYIEGNHFSMLENPKLVQIINENDPALESKASFKKHNLI
ncbi:hypothetical protein ACKWTF_009050 [Chironomus riparius]